MCLGFILVEGWAFRRSQFLTLFIDLENTTFTEIVADLPTLEPVWQLHNLRHNSTVKYEYICFSSPAGGDRLCDSHMQKADSL